MEPPVRIEKRRLAVGRGVLEERSMDLLFGCGGLIVQVRPVKVPQCR